MNQYSDNGVDLRVVELLAMPFGYACDVGANDGTFNSNTLVLEEMGWYVLCVEPNPHLAADGRMKRKLWREVACSDKDSEDEDFAIYTAGPKYASGSCLGKFNRNTDLTTSDNVPPMTAKVVTRRLDRVLEEAGFPRLDFLTVDVEGWEDEVMAGFTVERWKPEIIVLESWTERVIPIEGYTVLEKRQFDNIYQRNA